MSSHLVCRLVATLPQSVPEAITKLSLQEPASIQGESASTTTEMKAEETGGKVTGESSTNDTADKPDSEGESKQPATTEEGETSGDNNQSNSTVENKVPTPPPSAGGAKVVAMEEKGSEEKKDGDEADAPQSSSTGAPKADPVTLPSSETTDNQHGEEAEAAEQAPKPPEMTDPPAGGSEVSEHPVRPETLDVGTSGSSSGENPALSSSTRVSCFQSSIIIKAKDLELGSTYDNSTIIIPLFVDNFLGQEGPKGS